jgi:hypothetical protein
MVEATTGRKTPDIDGLLNVMFLKESQEFVERPGARSDGIDHIRFTHHPLPQGCVAIAGKPKILKNGADGRMRKF